MNNREDDTNEDSRIIGVYLSRAILRYSIENGSLMSENLEFPNNAVAACMFARLNGPDRCRRWLSSQLADLTPMAKRGEAVHNF